jgi:hypothetical protein
MITWQLDHLTTWQPDTWPPGHLTTWPPDHLATEHLHVYVTIWKNQSDDQIKIEHAPATNTWQTDTRLPDYLNSWLSIWPPLTSPSHRLTTSSPYQPTTWNDKTILPPDLCAIWDYHLTTSLHDIQYWPPDISPDYLTTWMPKQLYTWLPYHNTTWPSTTDWLFDSLTDVVFWPFFCGVCIRSKNRAQNKLKIDERQIYNYLIGTEKETMKSLLMIRRKKLPHFCPFS